MILPSRSVKHPCDQGGIDGQFNGDVGLILPDPDRRREMGAYFRDTAGGLRRFDPVRLPPHETVYALTIHKSQGSEFDHVLMILPDRDSPFLCRELIYTAVTRARKSVTAWDEAERDEAEPFTMAVSRRCDRSSGLRDALRVSSAHAADPGSIHLDN